MPKCTAHNRQGQRCGKDALRGTTVCRLHGGAAPQVREAARLRLLQAADPAAAELVAQLKNRKLPARDRRSAAVAVLDRAGLGPRAKFVSGEPDGGAATFEEVALEHYTDEELQTLHRIFEAVAVRMEKSTDL